MEHWTSVVSSVTILPLLYFLSTCFAPLLASAAAVSSLLASWRPPWCSWWPPSASALKGKVLTKERGSRAPRPGPASSSREISDNDGHIFFVRRKIFLSDGKLFFRDRKYFWVTENYDRACRLERALHGQAVTGDVCLVFIFIQSPGRELSTLIVNIIITIQPTKIPSQN